MARQLPVELHGRTASLVPVSHAVARDDHLSGDAVECVVDALSPVEPPSGGDAHLARGRERNRRLEPDRVARTEQLRAAGIGAALKQRVECLEVRVRGILVAARDVEDETETRRPDRIGEQMRALEHESPRANGARAEAAGLEHRFGVVRPHISVPDTRAEGVARFLRGALLEMCRVASETQVVQVEPHPLPRRRYHATAVQAPHVEAAVRRVVEDTGRAAQPSSRQRPACAITRTPSKLRGTFGPSRSAYMRPDPSAISWRPARRTAGDAPAAPTVRSTKAWCGSSLSSSITGRGPPTRPFSMLELSSVQTRRCDPTRTSVCSR